MAENTLNQARTDLASDLPLARLQKDESRFGIVNEKAIKEIAHILRSLGDVKLEVEQVEEQEKEKSKLKRRVSVEEYFSSSLRQILHTVGVVLDWLEQSSKNAMEEVKKTKVETSVQVGRDEIDRGRDETDNQRRPDDDKKEGVLRGLYHITALGSYTFFVDLLEVACKFLDVPENPYKAKREHIIACLKEVEEQKEEVVEMVRKACKILEEITKEAQFNLEKAMQFDNTVQQANDAIESCKAFLSNAEKTIDELSLNMTTVKYFSRVLRFTGFGVTCFGLYHVTPTSSSVDSLTPYVPSTGISLIKNIFFKSKLNYIGLTAACAVAGYAWLSYFPSKVYEFQADLEGLKLKHERLTQGIHSLERKLNTLVERLSKVKEEKMQSSREDSV